MLGTNQYITLKGAQAMMAAADAVARDNDWTVAIAIVDASANLIMFQRMDGVQTGSLAVSIGKAQTAAKFNRTSKELEDMVTGPRPGFLAVEGIVPVQGGVPVVVAGKVIGAVGVSGVQSAQDEQVAIAAIHGLQT
jgi:glc operon protein GlcG